MCMCVCVCVCCPSRFYELSGHYPDKVTVVSYRLKRDRFYGLHRAAVHFPETRFKFVGTELPPDVVGAQEGEVSECLSLSVCVWVGARCVELRRDAVQSQSPLGCVAQHTSRERERLGYVHR